MNLGFNALRLLFFGVITWLPSLSLRIMFSTPELSTLRLMCIFVREKVECGVVEIRYVPTMYQIADIFTKGLPKDRFQFLCHKLGLQVTPMYRCLPVPASTHKRAKREVSIEGEC